MSPKGTPLIPIKLLLYPQKCTKKCEIAKHNYFQQTAYIQSQQYTPKNYAPACLWYCEIIHVWTSLKSSILLSKNVFEFL